MDTSLFRQHGQLAGAQCTTHIFIVATLVRGSPQISAFSRAYKPYDRGWGKISCMLSSIARVEDTSGGTFGPFTDH